MPDLAAAGSQRWLQLAVNAKRRLVEEPLLSSLGGGSHSPLEWLCPLHSGGYREYKDLDPLQALGVPASVQHSLADFWPRRGPVWDGLARSANGDLLLLEAKAHIPELASGRGQSGPESLKKITQRLQEVREFLAPKSTAEWAHTFYQYANRLAFLYFLRQVNQLPARLESALALMYAALGLPRRHPLSPFIHNIFIDVGELQAAAA